MDSLKVKIAHRRSSFGSSPLSLNNNDPRDECVARVHSRSSMINCEGCKFNLSYADWCQFHLSQGGVIPGLLGVWEDSLRRAVKSEG